MDDSTRGLTAFPNGVSVREGNEGYECDRPKRGPTQQQGPMCRRVSPLAQVLKTTQGVLEQAYGGYQGGPRDEPSPARPPPAPASPQNSTAAAITPPRRLVVPTAQNILAAIHSLPLGSRRKRS